MRLLSILLFFILFSFSFAQIKITATIKPLADIAKEIVREKGTVKYIIPPNVSIHFYEYKISDIKAIYDSDIFVFIGIGEPNIKNLEKNATKEKINVSQLKELHKIKHFEFEEHHHKHKNHNEEIHPAVWLDPYNGKIIAKAIYEKLISLDPENKDFYKKNLDIFIQKVDKVFAYGKEKFSQLEKKYFISYHYTWPYFVKALILFI